jgi:7-carboxy-7-deazaguanine synthase
VPYRIAERFKSIQGEGFWTGTPMAFIRFAGCSVGKKVCHSCDTDFEQIYPWKDGGVFSARELAEWTKGYRHVCLTGGEPFDHDLLPLITALWREHGMGRLTSDIHIETSGTKPVPWAQSDDPGVWICVSPKPGYREDMIQRADEIKIIVPGLGAGDGWPDLTAALMWSTHLGKVVFLQPKNLRNEIDPLWLSRVQAILKEHPTLRLSAQLHKILQVP